MMTNALATLSFGPKWKGVGILTIVQGRVAHEIDGVAIGILLQKKLGHALVPTFAGTHKPCGGTTVCI